MNVMMRAVTTAMLLAPLSLAQAQPGRGGMGGPGMMRDQDPVSFLIENSKDLGLADDQITQLRTLRQQMRDQNKPLMDALGDVMPGGPPMMGGGGRGMRGRGMRGPQGGGSGGTAGAEDTASRSFQVPDTVRTLMRKLRENTDATREKAYAILSDEQKAKATELEEQWRQQMRGRRGGRGRTGGGGGGRHVS